MSKTISASKLKTLESSGAKVRRSVLEERPAEPKESVPTPVAPQVTPGSTEVFAMATANMERTEKMLSTTLVANESNIRELAEALRSALSDNARMSDPVPYEVEVVRRRDGLIDKFRITPVKPNVH
jgi:hypothetical protein